MAATVFKYFALMSFVTIDSSNDTIRATVNGATASYTMTHGTYWCGFGAANPASILDSAIHADVSTSFWEQFDADIGLSPAVQTQFNGASGLAQSPTGHVYFQRVLAGDGLDWSHNDSNMPRKWFGVADSTNTWVPGSGSYESPSAFSSSLCYIGDRTIGADRPVDVPRVNHIFADSGRSQSQSYAARVQRELTINTSGILRQEADSTAMALKRWLKQLGEARAGLRFYYFPDTQPKADGGTFLSKHTEQAADDSDNLYGFQDMTMAEGLRIPAFNRRERFRGYNREWQHSFRAQVYVS